MLIGLIAAIVLALGVGVLLLMTRQQLATAESSRATAVETSENSIKKLNGQLGAAEADLASATAAVTEIKSEKQRLTAELQNQSAQVAEMQAQVTSQGNEIQQQKAKLVAVTAERVDLQTKLADYQKAVDETRQQATLDELSDASPVRAETLWDLELTRSERTWRTSVSTNPIGTDDSPFDTAEDSVKTAVEIEAAALREDVGASVTVDWQAAKIIDPARCHLVLRVAQEMMVSASREPQPTKLIVTDDGELSLKIEPDTENEDLVITLSPPKIASDLIDISDEDGLQVTVKSLSEAEPVEATAES